MWVLNAPFRKPAIEDVKGGTCSALQTGTGKQTLARSLKREKKNTYYEEAMCRPRLQFAAKRRC